jgi:hypothetical protein
VNVSKWNIKIAASSWARESGGGEGGGVMGPRRDDGGEEDRVMCLGAVMRSGRLPHIGPAPRRRCVSNAGAGGGRRDSIDEWVLAMGVCEGPGVCVRGIDSCRSPPSVLTRFDSGKIICKTRTTYTVAARARTKPTTISSYQRCNDTVDEGTHKTLQQFCPPRRHQYSVTAAAEQTTVRKTS